jgi:hypothetical protein
MKYYQNKQTQSTYVVIYTTPVPTGVPFTGEEFVTLQCLKKYPVITDQEFVTLPKQLVNQFFSEVVDRVIED